MKLNFKNLIPIKNKVKSHSDKSFFMKTSQYSTVTKKNDCEHFYNPIVYRCVNLISSNLASNKILLYQKIDDKIIEITSHSIIDLLNKPNDRLSGKQFFEEISANLLLHGNCYIHLNKDSSGMIKSMNLLRPDRVSVSVNQSNQSLDYNYNINDKNYIFNNFNIKSTNNEIIHIKNFNPYNDLYGLSPLLVAKQSIEQYDSAIEWNKSLLKNGARPSGALIIKDKNGNGYLTDEQFYRLKQEIEEKFSGEGNSGKVMLLEGSMEWKEMGISPRDMDFIMTKDSAARDIAISFNIPAQILGIKGDNTFNNMKEARNALWEEAIIPLLEKIISCFNNIISQYYGSDFFISYDEDKIPNMIERRQELWNNVNNATFISDQEKREMLGFSSIQK